MVVPLPEESNLINLLDEISKLAKISFTKDDANIKEYMEKFDEYVDIDLPFAEKSVKDGVKYEVHLKQTINSDTGNKLETLSKAGDFLVNVATGAIQNLASKNLTVKTDSKPTTEQKTRTSSLNQGSSTKTEETTTTMTTSSKNNTSTPSKINATQSNLRERVTEESLKEKYKPISPEAIVPGIKTQEIKYETQKIKVAYSDEIECKETGTIETAQARAYYVSEVNQENQYEFSYDETLIRQNITQHTAMLGDLYDATKEKFIGMNIFTSKNLPKEARLIFNNQRVESDCTVSNKLSDKLNLLKVDGELKLSFLSGIVSVTGSGSYLNETRHAHSTIQCNLIYKSRTIDEKLHVTSDALRPFFCPSIGNEGTHVVVGVSYGANATMSLTYEHTKENSKSDWYGSLGSGSKSGSETPKTVVASTLNEIMGKITNMFGGGEISAQSLSIQGLDEKKMRFQVFADIGASEGSAVNTIQEAMEFIRNVPKVLAEGKGKQVEFTLLPLSILKKRLNLQIEADRFYYHIQAGTIKDVEHIFDQIEKSRQKLNEVETMVQKYRSFVAKSDKERIQDFRHKFDTSFSKFREELGKLVQKVRSGKSSIGDLNSMQNVYANDPHIGSKQIANFEESCEALKEKFTLLEEFEAHNVELITNYSELLKAKNKATDHDQELYVLFFSFSDQENDLKWADVIRYFFQRCKEIADLKKKQEDKSVSEVFMAIDTDVVPGVMRKESLNNGLRICLIISGNCVNDDVYAEYEKNKDKPVVICLERMAMNYEKNSMCQPLRLACPKSLRGEYLQELYESLPPKDCKLLDLINEQLIDLKLEGTNMKSSTYNVQGNVYINNYTKTTLVCVEGETVFGNIADWTYSSTSTSWIFKCPQDIEPAVRYTFVCVI
uniref:Uncharacterized protein n=1 Tax=Acrobeloides nanus TaxID=290746 RepID=A0A914C6Y5_9BILA